ncbi:hypothetical protein CSC17_1254 [Klebsiella oxytoca]|nr:hypothetical protein CSC17_1254 [Klebsiella oxytoca]
MAKRVRAAETGNALRLRFIYPVSSARLATQRANRLLYHHAAGLSGGFFLP